MTGARVDLALFDFDGTITHRETMPAFMRAAVSRRRLVVGWVVLLPLILGYKARVVSGVAVRSAICFLGFRGVAVRELERQGERFAMEVLPRTLRAEAVARIAWHKARGDTVVVVSGGLDVYLGHWCRAQGVELVCSVLEQRDGVLTGRYRGRQCVRGEKARLVRERFSLAGYGRVFAYGDTPEDRALLALADEAYYRWEPVGER